MCWPRRAEAGLNFCTNRMPQKSYREFCELHSARETSYWIEDVF
jgi:hypothetical protein